MKQQEIRPLFEAFFSEWWSINRDSMTTAADFSCADLGCVSEFLREHPQALAMRNAKQTLELWGDDLRKSQIALENHYKPLRDEER